MLLFYGIIFAKLKCFIDILAKTFFTNMWINIVKTKYNFFRFFQVYKFVNRSTKHSSFSLSYKAFEKVVKCAITKVKIGPISSLTEPRHIKVSV